MREYTSIINNKTKEIKKMGKYSSAYYFDTSEHDGDKLTNIEKINCFVVRGSGTLFGSEYGWKCNITGSDLDHIPKDPDDVYERVYTPPFEPDKGVEITVDDVIFETPTITKLIHDEGIIIEPERLLVCEIVYKERTEKQRLYGGIGVFRDVKVIDDKLVCR